MSADELDDYLAMQDPTFQRAITASNADIKAGRVRPARDLLAEFEVHAMAVDFVGLLKEFSRTVELHGQLNATFWNMAQQAGLNRWRKGDPVPLAGVC